MEILTNREAPVFNKIRRGSLIRCRHKSWKEPRNGIVAYSDEKIIRVLWLVGFGMNASYFLIRASEVAQSEYDIWLSFDCEEIFLAEIADHDD